MTTHPHWRPFVLADLVASDAAVVGTSPPGTVHVVPYDEAWAEQGPALVAAIREVLGDRVLVLEHVGSTSVPGLAAKPVLDLDLTVADPTDEASYVPDLEPLGLLLHIREPEWDEHRMLTKPDRSVNLHVFGPDSPEPHRVVAFRDWLRTHPEDRACYAEMKRRLSEARWASGMDYNNAKAPLIYDIYERIFAADSAHEHDPQPRT